MKSSSQHVFAQVPHASIPRSSFRRNMTWKTAFDGGYLVPIYVDEALPGDTFNCKITQFCRLSSPMSLPVMDNIYLDTFFFAVPIRLLWKHFVNLCGEQANPGDSTDYLAPILDQDDHLEIAEQSLSDYLGLPVGDWQSGTTPLQISSLWHRAYNMIWNEWFRDQNLQDRVWFSDDDGPDAPERFQLLRRGKRHDYFTSALPWVQKGPAASIGIAGYAPVTSWNGASSYALQFSNWATPSTSRQRAMLARTSTTGSTSLRVPNYSVTDNLRSGVPVDVNAGDAIIQNNYPLSVVGGLWADLSEASSVTVNSLRESFAIQRLLERDARSGTRFFEILNAHFGVTSPDSRLQRPEYLGGGHMSMQQHTVAQTSATETGSLTPQGNLAAYGVGGNRCGFVKSFVEHSVIIGLASLRCDLTYQQGLHRMFSRRSRFDWYWPALHNLGEQAVMNREIYVGNDGLNDQPFGYQERWAEYRYGQSRITGKLRSQAAASLDAWHLAQDFATRPVLGSDFISERPPLARVLAVQDEPQVVYDSLIELNCVRPMGCYSVPGLMDHL